MSMQFEATRSFAEAMDAQDPVRHMRDAFHIPQTADGRDEIYLCGNSLGLQPKRTAQYVTEDLENWQRRAVKGHMEGEHPFLPYHEFLTEGAAQVAGAMPSEVVCMNTLTANLHLLMVSFYRPTPARHRILIEAHAFPSDHYAAMSQLRFHGYGEEALLVAKPREGEEILRTEDLLELIEREGDTIALVLLPGVHYYTGQVFDMAAITAAAHRKGCVVGFDLAHAAGNVPLKMHDWGVDFAAWCNYKYLNSGPGAVAGAFVHERHLGQRDLPRFEGWWGHDKKTRFLMENRFEPIPTAEAWQLSNPPILSLSAIRASYDTFKEAGWLDALRPKALKLTGFLRFLLTETLGERVEVITPNQADQSGCQLSLSIKTGRLSGREVFDRIEAAGVTADWREPNVIRVAPTPLYNRFTEVFDFVQLLKSALEA